jgi:hypothetical protein
MMNQDDEVLAELNCREKPFDFEPALGGKSNGFTVKLRSGVFACHLSIFSR